MRKQNMFLAVVRYYFRKIKVWFIEPKVQRDERGNYYTSKNLHYVLYWRAYQDWQKKRAERRQANVGTELFEQCTNIKK